ncbi:SDR family oxidoreductase [Haladaptatus sp. DFWS20]|uniref:SDR family oxidoreductase n=1 Tax=Haladaptatus sp. DFWS20 TaxID=3403467 RepID=UPI003EC03D03
MKVRPFLGAVETALWDAFGKKVGVPAISCSVARPARWCRATCLGILGPEESRVYAKRAVEYGFSTLKTKAGANWHEDVERIRAMHDGVRQTGVSTRPQSEMDVRGRRPRRHPTRRGGDFAPVFGTTGSNRHLRNVRVAPESRSNAICPGSIITDASSENLTTDGSVREVWLNQYPVGRFGRPEDVAAATFYLTSADASFVTGTELVVDGGLTAGLD